MYIYIYICILSLSSRKKEPSQKKPRAPKVPSAQPISHYPKGMQGMQQGTPLATPQGMLGTPQGMLGTPVGGAISSGGVASGAAAAMAGEGGTCVCGCACV
jgi:hypothetical protein